MVYPLIFIAALAVLVTLFVAGLYIALQRHSGQDKPTEQIQSSGVYHLRHSPRDAIRLNKPEESELRLHLESQGQPPDRIAALIRAWNAAIDENLRAIEESDYQEVRTFSYKVPDDETRLHQLLDGVYVTRDQLSGHPELIPPFYPGCRAVLQPRRAWDAGDWRPMLPGQDGRYPVPDWRENLA